MFEEVQTAEDFFRKLGIRMIDVTSKSIESSADEIIRLITLRMG